MTYLLDANVCIHCLRKKGNALVKQRVTSHPPSEIALCSVVTAELFYGAETSATPAANWVQVEAFVRQFTALPFGEPEARAYARIRADLAAQGKIIGHYDLFIAAIAITSGLILVTHNTGEFSRVRGIRLDDWEVP
jgi:tRNA(fMet)-specific endonuclease VapC